MNPDAVPEPGAVAALAAFMDDASALRRRRARGCYPDGRWQPSRRRFPTVSGTIVRRTPLRKLVPPSAATSTSTRRRRTSRCEADWMLGGFLLLRRAMLDELGGFDEGFRLYGEDIDLAYRAMQAGWERWYVPAAVVRARAPGGDRQALADAAHALALGGHPPLRPQAP